MPEVESVLVSDIDMFSLEDLVRTRAGDMLPVLKSVLTRALHHVSECDLCKARGHICTVCNHDNIIFPFMVTTIQLQFPKFIHISYQFRVECMNVTNATRVITQHVTTKKGAAANVTENWSEIRMSLHPNILCIY